MKIIDAYILARTKRKTRRIRTALVTVVSSLLFSILFFVVIVAAGVMNSANQVKDVGYNSRYLTSVLPTNSGSDLTKADYDTQDARIKAAMNAELRARKIAVTKNTPDDPSYQIEFQRRISEFFFEQSLKAVTNTEAKLKALGHQSALYHFDRTDFEQRLTYWPDPTKDPKVDKLVANQNQKEAPDTAELTQEYFIVEDDMLRTQLLPGQSFDWQPGQPVPVVLSYPQLEKLAGRSYANVDAAIKNAGYKELISEYSGKVLDYCWRNITADQQLNDVVQYNYRAEHDTDKKTNPIAIPVCGGFDQALLKKIGLIVTPSASDPKPLFEAPALPAPKTTKIQLKIVGLTPGTSQFMSGDAVEAMLNSIGSLPFANNPILIPAKVAAQEPLLQPLVPDAYRAQTMFFVDSPNREEQKEFLKNGCSGNDCGLSDKPYMMPFGNVAVGLENVFSFFTTGLLIAGGVTIVIAGLLIFFTISKVIADSTKEIGVFRALGARRRDIAQIYFTYGGMLAISSLLFAAIIGVAVAYSLNLLEGDKFTAALVQAVGAYSQDVHASLVGFDPLGLLYITGALLLAATIGIIIPVALAAQRKLITILREE